jgi:hypothetical protein
MSRQAAARKIIAKSLRPGPISAAGAIRDGIG